MRVVTNPLVGHKPFQIVAHDPTGNAGGASSTYEVHWLDKNGSPQSHAITFQDGPIGEVGWNGVIDEALTAILLDRLYAWQESPFRNRENALVATALEESLLWRLKRTLDRESRQVEGTHNV